MVLYEALTGYRRPLGEDHLANAGALRQLLPNPTDLRPDADPGLVAVLERALATDPADRWPSADAMSAALTSSGGTRVLPVVDAPTGRFGRRPRWLLPLVAAVAAVLVATSVSLLVSNLHRARTPGGSTSPTVQTTNPAPPTTAKAPVQPVTTTPTSQANQAGANQQPAPNGHHHGGGGDQGGGGGGD
jgi:serine/threonine-protein kinase